MRLYLTLLFLLLAKLTLNAQSDSLLVETFYDTKQTLIKERYYIHADSLKNGPFTYYSKKGKILRNGRYTMGKPAGIWIYYENNNWNRVISKFDWTLFKEIEFHRYSKTKVNFPILIDGKTHFLELDTVCRFPGGDLAYQHYIQEIIKSIDTGNTSQGKASIHFLIDESGKVSVLDIKWENQNEELEPINPKLEIQLRKLIEEMPDWIPHSMNGIHYPQTYVLPIGFNK